MIHSTGAEQDKIQIFRQRGFHKKQKKNGRCFKKSSDGALEPTKRFPAHSAITEDMTTRGFDEFVAKSTQMFFDQLEIEMQFLDQNSATWEQHEGVKKQLSIVKELQVVNDIVESGVALIEDYNRFMTKNEDEMHNFCYKLWNSSEDHFLIAAKERCYQKGQNKSDLVNISCMYKIRIHTLFCKTTLKHR